MKKKIGEIYLIEFILFISIIVFNLLYKNDYFLNGFIILIGLFTLFKYKMPKDNNYIKSNVIKIVVSCILSFFIVIYMAGLFLGFSRTIFSPSIKYLFDVVGLDAVVIVFEEIIRYIICKNSYKKKLPVIIYTLLLIVLNIIIEINGVDFGDSESIFIFICSVVLPAISRESICSFLTYKVSYIPSLIFRFILMLYQYLLPIIPKLGNYIYSVTYIALPYFIYLFSSRIIYYNEKTKINTKNALKRIFYLPLLGFLFILIILISGIFSHTLIAVGSNSMKPVYERGDAVIYQKVEPADVKVGEILAFDRDGIIITHRVIAIKNEGNKYLFRTKGDANNGPDTKLVDSEDVLGTVKYSIKYIGYPTIWFNEVLNGKEIN